MALTRAGKVRIPEAVMIRELEGESVLLNLDSEAYFGLDEIGTRMWAVLTESASIGEACGKLLDEYEVEPAVLEADLDAFVGKLAEAGLLELVDA